MTVVTYFYYIIECNLSVRRVAETQGCSTRRLCWKRFFDKSQSLFITALFVFGFSDPHVSRGRDMWVSDLGVRWRLSEGQYSNRVRAVKQYTTHCGETMATIPITFSSLAPLLSPHGQGEVDVVRSTRFFGCILCCFCERSPQPYVDGWDVVHSPSHHRFDEISKYVCIGFWPCPVSKRLMADRPSTMSFLSLLP